MRGFTKALLVTAMTALPLASHATAPQNIGVVDIQKALLQSHAAQSYAKSSQKHLQPELDALSEQRDKIKTQEDKLKKNSLTLSKSDLKKKEASLEQEKQTFLQKLQALRQEKETADQTELKRLEPQLQQAVSQIATKDHYTLVIDKSAVIYQKGDTDITSKVVAELDNITKKSSKK